MKPRITPHLMAALIGVAFTTTLHAQTSAFTYQGQLAENGGPAGGIYDLRFTIYDLDVGGGIVGGPVTNSAVTVSNGLFTATLDFGASVFDGNERWLEIGVVTNGGGVFSDLSPRQQITSTPYALRALAVSSNALANYSGAVSFTNLSNTFAGDGSALSNINVTTLDGLAASDFWQLGGNAGTTAGTDFLGTSDNQPLDLKVDNQRALRLESAGAGLAPNLIGGYSGNVVSNGVQGTVIAGGGGASGDENIIQSGASYSTISGGERNRILANSFYSTIAGGFWHSIAEIAPNSTIGGGSGNSIDAASGASTIAGGGFNHISNSSPNSVIGGGTENRILVGSSHGTISGGYLNQITNAVDYATISGGRNNTVAGGRAAIGGGMDNIASGSEAAVAGGLGNTASSSWAFVGGGQGNVAAAGFATVAGGRGNQSLGGSATVGGGNFNNADGSSSTIGGGDSNEATVSGATVGGGHINVASGFYATVGGGQQNQATLTHTVVSGGQRNRATGNWAAVLGGEDNSATSTHSFVGGGRTNRATGSYSAVLGGIQNQATGNFASVPGGFNNTAGGEFSVAMGNGATASANRAVAIGSTAVASGAESTAIGLFTTASGPQSTAMGDRTIAAGVGSTAMGWTTEANGDYSTAVGAHARADHDGTFVYADLQSGYFSSTTNNQFLIRAENGIGLGSSNTVFGFVEIQQPSDDINHGLAIANVSRARTLRLWVDGSDRGHIDSGPAGGANLVINEGGGNVGIGASVPQHALDVVGNIVATGTITSSSDRNVKVNFEAVDPQQVLAKVAAMPIQRWNYIGEETPHMGPVAQDFHAAFGVGMDDKHISMVDADGVALAAIQGLNEKVEGSMQNAEVRSRQFEQRLKEKDTEIAQLKHELEKLKQVVDKLANANP